MPKTKIAIIIITVHSRYIGLMIPLTVDWTIENKGTRGLMHTHHITKLLKSHLSLIWLRGSVGKAHLLVWKYRDTFLKSNEEKVSSKPEVNILFFLFFDVVCFSVLFLFMCFRDYLNTCDIKMHFSLSCCLYWASIWAPFASHLDKNPIL